MNIPVPSIEKFSMLGTGCSFKAVFWNELEGWIHAAIAARAGGVGGLGKPGLAQARRH